MTDATPTADPAGAGPQPPRLLDLLRQAAFAHTSGPGTRIGPAGTRVCLSLGLTSPDCASTRPTLWPVCAGHVQSPPCRPEEGLCLVVAAP
jgi:hypothetical protein